MKNVFYLWMAGFMCLLSAKTMAATQYADSIRFHFASVEEAQALLSADDSFTLGWSEFDIVSRLQKPNGTREELMAFRRNEAREWTTEEKNLIWQDMLALNQIIREKGYRLPLPEKIVLVKSTLKDEGGAGGYTQSNWIALATRWIEKADAKGRRYLLLHELSHILTRNSAAYKKRLYGALGFQIVPEGLEYPEELRKVRISNPDIAAYDSYGPFRIKGSTHQCAMYLYADRPYESGFFFEYVKIGFVPYDEQLKPMRDANGKLVVYGMEDVEDFEERVGKNTSYTLHPEEILAENFVLAFLQTPDVPTPALQQRVLQVLLKN